MTIAGVGSFKVRHGPPQRLARILIYLGNTFISDLTNLQQAISVSNTQIKYAYMGEV